MLAHSTQVPLSTASTPGAQIPVATGVTGFTGTTGTTSPTGGQVYVQFQDPGHGQTYTAQPIQPQTWQPQPTQPQPTQPQPTQPQPKQPQPMQRQRSHPQLLYPQPLRLQPGLPPSPPTTTPGTVGGAVRKADTMKSSILGSYTAARSLLFEPNLDTHEFARRLESYRLLCHELINKSWAAGRIDLAVAVASDALPLYRRCAQLLQMQAQIVSSTFYANFSAWGLSTLNASLQHLSMMGHALQCAWHPRLPDGRVNPTRMLVLRTAEPLLPMGVQRAHPGMWSDARDNSGATPQAPWDTVTSTTTTMTTTGKVAAWQDNEQRQDPPVEVIEKLWQTLALTHGLNGPAFAFLMRQHTHFTSNVERVRFGMTLVELLKGLVNLYYAGNLKMERDVFKECLSAGFARIGLLNRAYRDKFAADLPPSHDWQSGSMQDGEEGEASEVSPEGDAVRVHFIWSLAHSGQFFAHFKDFLDDSSNSASSWIVPQRVVSLLKVLFPIERTPATPVLSERELHCLASLNFSASERSPKNFIHVVRDASQRLVELPPLPVFAVPRLQIDAFSGGHGNTPLAAPVTSPVTTPGGTRVTTPIKTPITTPISTPISTPVDTQVSAPFLTPDVEARFAMITATTATAPAAGSTGGPSSVPTVAPSTTIPVLDEYQPMDEIGFLFGSYADEDFF